MLLSFKPGSWFDMKVDLLQFEPAVCVKCKFSKQMESKRKYLPELPEVPVYIRNIKFNYMSYSFFCESFKNVIFLSIKWTKMNSVTNMLRSHFDCYFERH